MSITQVDNVTWFNDVFEPMGAVSLTTINDSIKKYQAIWRQNFKHNPHSFIEVSHLKFQLNACQLKDVFTALIGDRSDTMLSIAGPNALKFDYVQSKFLEKGQVACGKTANRGIMIWCSGKSTPYLQVSHILPAIMECRAHPLDLVNHKVVKTLRSMLYPAFDGRVTADLEVRPTVFGHAYFQSHNAPSIMRAVNVSRPVTPVNMHAVPNAIHSRSASPMHSAKSAQTPRSPQTSSQIFDNLIHPALLEKLSPGQLMTVAAKLCYMASELSTREEIPVDPFASVATAHNEPSVSGFDFKDGEGRAQCTIYSDASADGSGFQAWQPATPQQ